VSSTTNFVTFIIFLPTKKMEPKNNYQQKLDTVDECKQVQRRHPFLNYSKMEKAKHYQKKQDFLTTHQAKCNRPFGNLNQTKGSGQAQKRHCPFMDNNGGKKHRQNNPMGIDSPLSVPFDLRQLLNERRSNQLEHSKDTHKQMCKAVSESASKDKFGNLNSSLEIHSDWQQILNIVRSNSEEFSIKTEKHICIPESLKEAKNPKLKNEDIFKDAYEMFDIEYILKN
jgi:hypothetical protein